LNSSLDNNGHLISRDRMRERVVFPDAGLPVTIVKVGFVTEI